MKKILPAIMLMLFSANAASAQGELPDYKSITFENPEKVLLYKSEGSANYYYICLACHTDNLYERALLESLCSENTNSYQSSQFINLLLVKTSRSMEEILEQTRQAHSTLTDIRLKLAQLSEPERNGLIKEYTKQLNANR